MLRIENTIFLTRKFFGSLAGLKLKVGGIGIDHELAICNEHELIDALWKFGFVLCLTSHILTLFLIFR
jgi:hypothetical protein